MKKVFNFISTALFLLISVSFYSCQKNDLDILGTWNSKITLKNELSISPESLDFIGAVYVVQENEFTFNSDLSFTRQVSQTLNKAESYDESFSDEDLFNNYKPYDTLVLISGTYSIRGKHLTLHSEEIEQNGVKSSYADYYSQINSLGPENVRIPLTVTKSGELIIQGITFSKK